MQGRPVKPATAGPLPMQKGAGFPTPLQAGVSAHPVARLTSNIILTIMNEGKR